MASDHRKLTIGFVGNFNVEFTTEQERKWSFEQLGHTVIPYQENLTTANHLKNELEKLDMLVYSHTHDPSYVIDGLKDVFKRCKALAIPTVSVHLDRWLWLKRVEDMGHEATWFTEYIFMADGSPEAADKYNELGLNWFYLAPAVVARGCYKVEPNHAMYPHEVVFTGSRGYHPEYPFRAELVDFLKLEYGHRFGHYGNDGIKVVRQEALNTLYSTAKIVVGDSCFGGRPQYTSDRYYEVRGRNGFLLHPHVDGVETHGVASYKAGDLDDLKKQIDYWLEHDQERESMREQGFDWVKNNETYTERAQTIIDTVFGNE